MLRSPGSISEEQKFCLETGQPGACDLNENVKSQVGQKTVDLFICSHTVTNGQLSLELTFCPDKLPY